MNWYEHFFQEAEIGDPVFGALDDSWTEKELFIALASAQANIDTTTKKDLKDLVRAYKDYRNGVRLHESRRKLATISGQ